MVTSSLAGGVARRYFGGGGGGGRERLTSLSVRLELQSSRRLVVIAVAPASGWLRPSPRHKET